MQAKRRRAYTISAAAAALLLVPAAAEAATYSVATGGGACSGQDLTCGTLAEAAAAVGPGDVVNVGDGAFAGATFTDANLSIIGKEIAPGGLPSSQLSSPLVFTGGGTATVSNLAISTPGGPALDVQGAGSIDLRRSIVLALGSNGMTVDDGASVRVSQTRVISAPFDSAGLLYTPGGILGGAKNVVLRSSVFSGGPGGAGVKVDSSGLLNGTVTIDGVHVTVAGSASSFSLNANTTVISSIVGSVSDSIVSGPISTNQPLLNGVLVPTVNLDTTQRNDLLTPPAQLFVNPGSRDYNLLASAPVIGQGAAAGAADFDVDGQQRESGLPTDRGADEFFNTAPVAKVASDKPDGRQNRPVTFSAAGSVDRDGPLVGYRWKFSDGQAVNTTTPTVQHSFAAEGRGGVELTVVDGSGAVSPPAQGAVNILDGVAPLVGIDVPTANKTLKRFKTTTKTNKKTKKKTKTKKKQAIKISGRAADKSGMKQVLLTIRQVSRSKAKSKKAPAKKSQVKRSQAKSTAKCRWVKRVGISVRSCQNPVLLSAKLDAKSGKWSYTIPASRIPSAGTYEVAVIGVDGSGAFGNSAPLKNAKITFKLR